MTTGNSILQQVFGTSNAEPFLLTDSALAAEIQTLIKTDSRPERLAKLQAEAEVRFNQAGEVER